MESTTNQVRQVLMNELGLTRETVRAEMIAIIGETVGRALKVEQIDKRINDRIAFHVNVALKTWRQDTTAFAKFVKDETVKEARRQIGELVLNQIDIKLFLKQK